MCQYWVITGLYTTRSYKLVFVLHFLATPPEPDKTETIVAEHKANINDSDSGGHDNHHGEC